MHFERISSDCHPLYETALKLYQHSFPPHEQRSPLSQSNILGDPAYHFSLLCDGSSFVGLALYWETERFLYVEHLCIAPELRNQSYGQQALALLGQAGKLVILEIDPPVDAIPIRRKGFYIRNGFVENPYPHLHPPYHRENSGHPLVVMSFPRGISPDEYDSFQRYLEQHVMGNALL